LIGEIDKLEAWARAERTLTAEDVAAIAGAGMAKPLYRLTTRSPDDPASALAWSRS
jgi:hypothetical protein